MTFESGSPRGEAELTAFASILAWAFGDEPPAVRAWLERGGLENVRVARRGDAVIGGLLEIPMGQWFGGRSVPMLGVAGVGVAAEARGGRVALTLLIETLRAAKSRGLALSALYPSAIPLYRSAGYELAGARFRHTAALCDLPSEHDDQRILPLDPSAAPVVDALYRRIAAERPGYLDRGPYIWRRVRAAPNGDAHLGFGVLGATGLDGYVYLSQRGPDEHRELVVHDLVAVTPGAGKRLLALLAAHRSTLKSLVFYGTTPEPLTLHAPGHCFRVELAETWMLRVLDVESALTARGYPDLETSIDLELDDTTLPENSGRYRLEVSGGRAQVTRGGTGAVTLDERALAALYSGYLAPAALSRVATLSGDAASLQRLTALFAGPSPAMSNYF